MELPGQTTIADRERQFQTTAALKQAQTPGALIIEFTPQVNAELSQLAEDQHISVMDLIRRALGRERFFHNLREQDGQVFIETDKGNQKFVLL